MEEKKELIQTNRIECDLCKQQTTRYNQYLYDCIEEQIQICFSCAAKIRHPQNYCSSQNIGYMYFTLYKQQIEVYYDSPNFFYKLKYNSCEICLYYEICSKICKNDHYVCLKCISKYVKSSLRKQQIRCPYQSCDQNLDDFTIARTIHKWAFPEWNRMVYNLFCPNRLCSKIIRFRPYEKVQTQIKFVNEFISECTNCKAQICNNCWMQYEGSHTPHLKKCSTDQYHDQLFQQYINQNSLVKCPKCGFYSEQACTQPLNFQSKIQKCQLCNTQFCLICKTEIIQLFRSRYSKPNCYKCELISDKVLNKRQKIQKIKEALFCVVVLFLTPALILVIAFRLTITIGKPIIEYTKYLLGITKILQKRFLLILIFPFVVVVVVIVIIVAYLILFIPLLFKNLMEKFKSLK